MVGMDYVNTIFISDLSRSLLEILVKILTRTLPRSMQDSDIKNHGESRLKMEQDLSQIYVWSMQDLDMVEPWYTQDPDMIKLWCTQDPYKNQYAKLIWLHFSFLYQISQLLVNYYILSKTKLKG